MNIEYDIVKRSSAYSLSEEVNKRIKDGWNPLGGAIPTCAESYNERWYQTMVREIPKPQTPQHFEQEMFDVE